MTPYKVLALGLFIVGCAFGLAALDGCSTPPVLVSPPDPQTGCYQSEHSCGPGLGCCDNDTETCCGLPESVGCNVPGKCLFIASGLGAPVDAGMRLRPQRMPMP